LGFYGFFWQFWAARHISRAKLSALNVVFTSLNFTPPAFKEFSVRGHQTLVPSSKYLHSAIQVVAVMRYGGAIWRTIFCLILSDVAVLL